jgi:hypothetical protein
MGKFLAYNEIYQAIQQASAQTKEALWVSSTNLSSGAHKVFSQEIIKNPPKDVRFVFPLNDATVKQGEVDPYEVQFLKENFSEASVKANDRIFSNIYIFDNIAFLTSASLTKAAFESNLEAAIMINDTEVDKLKAFFDQNLWQPAKPIGDLKKQKTLWNQQQKTTKPLKTKIKPHTQLAEWTDEQASTWYVGVLTRLSSKILQEIRKETNWSRELLLVGDVGYKSFKELELGDLIYLANLNSQPGKVQIQLAKVQDKAKVETDEGDHHLLCQAQKNFTLEREKFYDTLKSLGINSRSSDVKLSSEQLKSLSETLAAIKPKRKRKKTKKGDK